MMYYPPAPPTTSLSSYTTTNTLSMVYLWASECGVESCRRGHDSLARDVLKDTICKVALIKIVNQSTTNAVRLDHIRIHSSHSLNQFLTLFPTVVLNFIFLLAGEV